MSIQLFTYLFNEYVSVSLRSIIHSYFQILIILFFLLLFPSPYGVLFILIREDKMKHNEIKNLSFRLLTEYYSFLWIRIHLLYYQNIHFVSVSLRSIIHSYLQLLNNLSIKINYGFRLLTEYYSFLFLWR
mgnify:FL=1